MMSKSMLMVCACVLCLSWTGFAHCQAPDSISGEQEEQSDFDLLDCDECEGDESCCCECPFETIAKGEISGYHLNDPAFRGVRAVVRTPEAWARCWEANTSNIDPPPPLPPVDFQRSVVLIAVQGLRTSGGNPAIEFKKIRRCGDVTKARLVVRNRPGPLNVITNPFHIIKIPIACAPCLNTVAFVSHRPRIGPGAVAGRVSAAEEPGMPPEPLPGAVVRLVLPDPGPAVIAETETDEEGFYYLDEIAPGLYMVIATAEGYAPDAAPAVVRPGQTEQRDFVLLPPPPPPPDDEPPMD